MNKDSLYNNLLTDLETRYSMGHNYFKKGLLSKFLSPTMYGNPRLSTFLGKIDSLFIEILESVKRIQFYTNYTIDKNERRLNQ
jgi:hypothetical protein